MGVSIADYQRQREAQSAQQTQWRSRCLQCRNAERACYCPHLRPFSPAPRFAILIHRKEARRAVATGRMTHLTLQNSWLFEGTDFTDHSDLNRVLRDPSFFPVLLYPGVRAQNLSKLSASGRSALFPKDKTLVVILIDATWAQAKRMRRLSRNLLELPQIAFTPTKPSDFGVRRQPKAECYSTIEAAHEVLRLLGETGRESMLRPFHWMVQEQKAHVPLGPNRTRHKKKTSQRRFETTLALF